MRGTVVALAGLTLAACSSVAPIVQAVRTAPPDPKTQMAALETRIYQLIEAEREKIDPKAKPLVWDSELQQVARAHSRDMAAKHYLGHRSPSGQTSATIIMAEDANFQGLLGENIAAQYYTKEGGVAVDAYAKRFVQTWLKSKSHRENLTFPDYDRTGVGAAVNGNTVYVTQLFTAELEPEPKPRPGEASAASNGALHKDKRTVSMYSNPETAKESKIPRRDVQLRGGLGLGTLAGEGQ